MKHEIRIFTLLLLAYLMTGCGINNDNLIEEYNDFAIKCARMGLWNEAIMRWKRIVEMQPDNAKAHNNLGVAYESNGNFEAALAAYKTAVELDPENKVYAENYTKFKLNYERSQKNSETVAN
jgi:Flp pilus assembly protein TadD